jgi:hypothetical protein
MKKLSIFQWVTAVILILLLSSKTFAGKGAYLKVYNLTNTSLSISSANIGMNNFTNKNENTNSGEVIDFGYIEESKWSSNSDFTIFASKAGEGECRIKIKVSGATYYLDESDSNGLATFAYITYPDNQYRINIYITYPNNRWMTRNNKIQNSTLSEFCMPGAHDAAMGKVVDCSSYANSSVTQTQNKTFRELLDLGVRYFDLRTIIDENNNLRFGHFSYVGKNITIGYLGNEGCMGYDLNDLLNDVSSFISENGNNELVILEFSHFANWKKYGTKGDTKFDNEDLERLKTIIEEKLSNSLIKNTSDLTKLKVSDLTGGKGKILALFDAPGFNGASGIHSLSRLPYKGSYSDTESVSFMKQDQFQKMRNESKGNYFQMSWTLTQQSDNTKNFIACYTHIGCTSIHDLANSANQELFDLVEVSEHEKLYPNVLYTDYISNEQQVVISSLLNLKR